MKRLIFLFIFFSLVARSQLQKGMTMPGGNFSYWQTSNDANDPSTKYSGYKVTDFNSDLNYGYFFSNKIVAGALGGYRTSTGKSTFYDGDANVTSKKIEKSYGAGLFARTYKMIKGDQFAVFCQLDASYLWGESVGNGETSRNGTIKPIPEIKGKINGAGMALRPGLAYFLTRRIGIELSLGSIGYVSQKTVEYSEGIKTRSYNSEGLNINFTLSSLSLGVNFYLGGKEQ